MQKLSKDKKGVLSLAQVGPVVIVLLTIGIVLTVGLLIMSDVEDQVASTTGCNNTEGNTSSCASFAFNGTISAQEGLDVIASFQSIFGIVIAAAVVLGLVALFR